MSKTITATRQTRDGQTVTRTFEKITWDLLPADKGGFTPSKSATEPAEVKTDKKDKK